MHFISLVNAEKSNFKVGAVIGNATPTQMHTVVVAVQQNNLDKIKSILDDISNIDSPNYGKHLTREEIAEYTKDQPRIDRITKYFTSRGAKLVEQTKHSEYLTMSGPVSFWNAELNTTLLHKRLVSGEIITCAHSMDIPHAVKDDVFSFFNVLQTPSPHRPTTKSNSAVSKAQTLSAQSASSSNLRTPYQDHDGIGLEDMCATSTCSGTYSTCCQSSTSYFCVPTGAGCCSGAYYGYYCNPGYACSGQYCYLNTIHALDKAYSIGSNTAPNSQSSQAVYESLSQYFSPSDLSTFQSFYGMSQSPMSYYTPGWASDSACTGTSGGKNCGEANLDVQYIMGVAQGVPTSYLYDDNSGGDAMVTWLTKVGSQATPPKVLSISYGWDEKYLPSSLVTAFDNEAMKVEPV